ncbi:MAG: uracil-DNA glycosylase [Deltaproteobacteria bacterium]|nr:uracil-DNA glycosylase [Deltaproteobacteria bacterium]
MSQPAPDAKSPPNCRNCRHYFITWEHQRPHGCRAMGFKSQYLPHVHVRQTSGHHCRLFSPRKPRP